MCVEPLPDLCLQLGEEEEEEEEEEEGGDEEEAARPKLYIPPKVAAMPYGEAVVSGVPVAVVLTAALSTACAEEEGKRWQEKQKQKVFRGTLVQDLRNEYLDLPEEVHVSHMLATPILDVLISAPLSYEGCWLRPAESKGYR